MFEVVSLGTVIVTARVQVKVLVSRPKIVALTMKAEMVKAQNLKMIWTVECHLMKTLKKILTQLRSKKKIGLIT